MHGGVLVRAIRLLIIIFLIMHSLMLHVQNYSITLFRVHVHVLCVHEAYTSEMFSSSPT